VVFDFQGVGDNVLSIPFLSVVPELFRGFNCYLLIGTGRRDLFLGLKGFHVIEVQEASAVAEVLGSYHEIAFDLGTGENHLTSRTFGTELKYGTYVGFSKPRRVRGEVAVPMRDDVPMWKQYLTLLEPFGVPNDLETEYEIVANEEDAGYVRMLVDLEQGIPLITIAPGASSNHRKRWPPERFADLVGELQAVTHCRFVLVGRPSENDIGEAIARHLPFHVDNLVGITPLGAIIELVRHSRLLVANDNGIMHIGGLLNTPTLGLFGPSDVRLFHPLGRRSRALQSPSPSMTDLEVSAVLEASLDLLRKTHSGV
jgi:ADP-heptose:LPS heptosyltransferase